MPSPNNRGSWPEGPDEVERLLLFPTAAQCPFSLCSCRAWRIRASAGLRGQIWADAAFRSLTIRKYSLRSGPCLNPNLLRGNCEAPVSWHFSRDFCAQRARLGSSPSKRGETKSAEKGRSQAVPSRICHARRKWTKRESTPREGISLSPFPWTPSFKRQKRGLRPSFETPCSCASLITKVPIATACFPVGEQLAAPANAFPCGNAD